MASVKLPLVKPLLVGVEVGFYFGFGVVDRDAIDAAEPAVQVHVGAAGRAEGLELRGGGPAADGAGGQAGFGGFVGGVGHRLKSGSFAPAGAGFASAVGGSSGGSGAAFAGGDGAVGAQTD